MGGEISRDYAGTRTCCLVSVLKGSVVFMADLMRAITIPRPDRLYGHLQLRLGGEELSGVVKIVKDLDLELAGLRHRDCGGHPGQRQDPPAT